MQAAGGMNTTMLIEHWSMAGADRDQSGRVRTAEELRAVFRRDRTPSEVAASLRRRAAHEQESQDSSDR
jgi:hypothetical protein